MSGFGSLQPRTGSKDSVKLDEVIEMHKWPADEWSQVRFLPGKILPVKRHWIKILAGKEKKEITIPRYCIAFDPENENEPRKNAAGKPIKCPYCELTHGQEGSARYEFFYLANAIIREIQEDEPRKKSEPTKEERKSGFKDIRSKSWTPIRVCRITSSVAQRIQELSEGNMVKGKDKSKKAYDVTHEKYGIDIRVKFKPKGAGTDKYSADKDERTPLTDDEKAYLKWKLDSELLDVTGRMEQKQAEEDFKRMDVVGGDTPDDEDDDGYNLGDDSKKSKKGKKSKKAFSDDEDDDEDDKPKKSKKKKAAFADDDDDDDDEPKKKKGKKSKKSDDDDDDEPKKSKKKKPAFSDDDDDDEDDKPKKKKGKKSKSDDDDEDEPKKKKGDKSAKSKKSKDKDAGKSKKKSKKTSWDDDDE